MAEELLGTAIVQFKTTLDFKRTNNPKLDLVRVYPNLESLFKKYPSLTLEYRYSEMDVAMVERFLLDANGAPDLSFHPDLCFSMDLGGEDPDVLIPDFQAHGDVTSCEVSGFAVNREPVPFGGQNQSYFEDWPLGNDLFTISRSVSYARGEKLRVFTIGYDYWRDHPEFKSTRHPIKAPKPLYGKRSRGTAIMAILAGSLGSGDMRGGLPLSEHYVLPLADDKGALVVDTSIMSAISLGKEGDIIVISGWAAEINGFDDMPVECVQTFSNAIRKASDMGFLVVESAGDGSYNLDSFVDSKGRRVLDPSSSDFRDSGAIMVGSSKVVNRRLERSDYTNFGKRITACADGVNIWSAVDSPNFPRNILYNGFEGNEYSTAVVASAIGVISSAFKGVSNISLSSAQMRIMLSFTGEKVDGIGKHPRLTQILPEWLAIFHDLYVRDFIGDDGSRHNRRLGLSRSPDIVVRQQDYNSPQTEIGQGSGQEENANLSQPVRRGKPCFIYVRALNMSKNDAPGAIADVYYARGSVLTTPKKWNLIGQAFFNSRLRAGNILEVSSALKFDSYYVPSGHYCMIAVISTPGDKAPDVRSLENITDWAEFIANSNNVAWRNFDVVGKRGNRNGGEYSSYEVDAGNPFPVSIGMQLEVTSNLPANNRVRFEMSETYAELFDPPVQSVRPGVSSVRIPASGTLILIKDKEIPEFLDLHLIFESLRTTGEDEDYEIYLRYMFNGIEIGRKTWIISSAADVDPAWDDIWPEEPDDPRDEPRKLPEDGPRDNPDR